MDLIGEDDFKGILSHYPEYQHKLITLQINKIESIIQDHQDRYFEDLSFRSGLDLILSEIIMGSFLIKGDGDEN